MTDSEGDRHVQRVRAHQHHVGGFDRAIGARTDIGPEFSFLEG